MCSPAIYRHHIHFGFRLSPRFSYSPSLSSARITPHHSAFLHSVTSVDAGVSLLRCRSWKDRSHLIAAMDEDSMDAPWYDEMGDNIAESYLISSSDGEDNEIDLLGNPAAEAELTTSVDYRLEDPDSAITIVAHRFANIQRGQKTNRKRIGVIITLGLTTFLASFLLFIDYSAWRITRLPLKPYLLTQPFSVSAVLSACAGWLYAPVADTLKIHCVPKTQGPALNSIKRTIPSMGGLFFIPIGIVVSRRTGLCSAEVNGAAILTLAFATIGLIDDVLVGIRSKNDGLPEWLKFFLQVALGTWFSIWLESADVATPYSMKSLVPLPPPIGIIYMGKLYRVLTTSSCATMGSGFNLIDGLDGLAGGVAALAFIGVSIAALPISQDLAVFGASMSGACIGFLFNNRYRASVCMGSIGSLALGGALAAIAASTGMFYPLFLSSGVLLLEILSVALQVPFVLATKPIYRAGRYISRLGPLHYYLRLYGFREPEIVACAYTLSCILALYAGFIGLVSA